ncbi:hypothetical protein I317_01544 [Kwoniella heveanensis CBS 569]|nr:hypothetical protein I317_01544 [Kwoniella heveanensis CBS 569]
MAPRSSSSAPTKRGTRIGERPKRRESARSRDTNEDSEKEERGGGEVQSDSEVESERGRAAPRSKSTQAATRSRRNSGGGDESDRREDSSRWEEDGVSQSGSDSEGSVSGREGGPAHTTRRGSVNETRRAGAGGRREEDRVKREAEADASREKSKSMKNKKLFDLERYHERSRQINSAWNKRPSAWSGCCGDCSSCWVKFWGWSGWRTVVRNAPYVLGLMMALGGVFVGATGDLVGVWTFEISGGRYGGLGYCKSGSSGAICLGASPLAWLLFRMTYRSRWAYFGSSDLSRANSKSSKSRNNGNGWDEEKYGAPAIDDRDATISSYEHGEGDGRPQRIRRPRGRAAEDDDDD